MTTYYTLKNNTKISGYFWDDYYTGERLYHIEMYVNEYNEKGEIKKLFALSILMMVRLLLLMNFVFVRMKWVSNMLCGKERRLNF